MVAKSSTVPPSNKYERVIVAAKEARRLNEWDAQLLDRPYRRLCEEAMGRVGKGHVRYTYEPAPPPPAPQSVPNPLMGSTSASESNGRDADVEPEEDE
jgi:DNA-directed RNA polymerase subunit K/omega